VNALRKVLVVGGSIAALTVVQTLRAEGFDGRVLMLSDEDRTPYTRVPLSKDVLSGRTPPDDIALDVPEAVDLRLRTPVLGLDLRTRVVRTAVGDVTFDGLVVASGARARRLPRTDPSRLLLRTHHDGTRLREAIAAAGTVRVIGGGFLGMEIASTCVDLGKRVVVRDLEPPLERLVGEHVSARLRAAAEERGVRFEIGDGYTPIEPADVVVSAIGDVPNTAWLDGAGLALHRGAVVVDSRGRAAAGVVAAGDVAVTRTGEGFRRLPTWTNAVEQARCAALALLHGDDASEYQPSRYVWTDQFGHALKMVGEPAPAGPPLTCEADADGELLTWPRTAIALNHPIRPAKLKRLPLTAATT
jgi:3-phenylpropionate/trans-cinnamate dioxygenase ferredoxin reductase component